MNSNVDCQRLSAGELGGNIGRTHSISCMFITPERDSHKVLESSDALLYQAATGYGSLDSHPSSSG